MHRYTSPVISSTHPKHMMYNKLYIDISMSDDAFHAMYIHESAETRDAMYFTDLAKTHDIPNFI